MKRQCRQCFMILFTLAFSVIKIHSQCTNYTKYVRENIGVEGSQLWKSKVLSLEDCMKMCVRRTSCYSMNYDLETMMCELNSATLDTGEHKSGTYLLYAEFEWLPAEIDPSCFSRPCSMNEVCIPNSSGASCAFYCMPAGRKCNCPMPEIGTVSGRYVGDVLNCEKGYTGNDSATCLPSGKWSKEVTGCEPIFGYSCLDDEICSLIGGKCSAKKCTCDISETYDTTINECVLDCGEPPLVNNAITTGNQSVMTYECESGFFPTTNSKDTIVCTQNGWEPSKNFYECFTCGKPPDVVGAALSGTEDDKVRRYTCDGDNDLRPKPGTTNGTITCDDGGWEPAGFECYGLRIGPIVQQEYAPKFNHIGYVEMFIEDSWSYVGYNHWTWKVANVACRDINSSLKYGGTFHKYWFNVTHPSRLNTIDLHRVSCTGHELSLVECEWSTVRTIRSQNNVIITCFDFDIMGGTYVYLQPVPVENYSIFMINLTNVHGAVCHDSGWSNQDEGLVACKTINSNWTATYNGEITSTDAVMANGVKCTGDEPHFLYCQNAGWGYTGGCYENEKLTIQCELDP